MKNQNHINRFFKTLGFWEKRSAEKLLIFRISDRRSYFYYLYRKKQKLEFIHHGLASSESPMAQEEFLLSLQKSLKGFKFKPDRVLVTISGPGVMVRTVDIPEVSEKNLKTSLFYLNKAELDRFHNDSIWDYQILEQHEVDGKSFLRILIIVLDSEFLDKVFFSIKQLGFNIGFLLPELVLYDAALNRLGIRQSEKFIINVNNELTSLFFYRNGKLLHSRTIPISSTQIRKNLDKEYSRNLKAIRRKLVDMGQPDTISDKVKNKVLDLSIKKSEMIQALLGEIRKSLLLVGNQFEFKTDTPLIALGDGLGIPGVVELIKTEFNREVVTPFPRFKPSDNFESSSSHSVAIGTALFNENVFRFVPQSVTLKKRSRVLGIAAIFGVMLWAVGIGWISAHKIKVFKQTFQDYNRVRNQAVEYTPKAKLFNQLNHEVRELVKKDRAFLKLGGYDFYPLIALKTISKTLPEGIAILKMEYDGMQQSGKIFAKKITLQGSTYENPQLWNKSYPTFMEALKNSGNFDHVIPIHSNYSDTEKKGVFLIELKKDIIPNE